MTELKLNQAQRDKLAQIFKGMLRDEKFYDSWGPTLKSLHEEAIVWYFTPFKGNNLPPVPCDSREELDDDGNVVDVSYKFKLELTITLIKELKRIVVLEKEIKQASLNGYV